MRQIIPFKKELLFKTKISEITSISLEHTLTLKEDDTIGGNFNISGDYKMTQASINREQFSFTLPFEITLDVPYKKDSLKIDIDNFYYEVVNDDSLQVNIDVYIDGEKQEQEVIEADSDKLTNTTSQVESSHKPKEKELEEVSTDLEESSRNKIKEDEKLNKKSEDIVESKELSQVENTLNREEGEVISKMIDESNNLPNHIEYNKAPKVTLDIDTKDSQVKDISNINQNVNNNINTNKEDEKIKEKSNPDNNINIFSNDTLSTETYVTYYVYLVKEDDTIDKIIEEFNITKEELANYNDITDIKSGSKLIIPSHYE